MFNALQKLAKYFNGIANSTSCLPTLFASCPAAPAAILYVLPVTLFLYWKAFQLTTLLLALSSRLASSSNSSL